MMGASPCGDRATHERSQQAVSAVRASVPSAWEPWATVPRDGTPFMVPIILSFDPASDTLRGLYRDPDTDELLWAPVSGVSKVHRFWCDTFPLAEMRPAAAQAIEARRAETGTGSVHESAGGEADAPGDNR